jgi:prepilin-type processing-associated H-X9-DG protein
LLLARRPAAAQADDRIMAPPETTQRSAGDAPMELQQAADGTALVLVWQDGSRTSLAATLLRRACRCAACVAGRARGDAASPTAPSTITALTPIGHYALNIAFSDGHARGVYPWAYLRTLAAEASERN